MSSERTTNLTVTFSQAVQHMSNWVDQLFTNLEPYLWVEVGLLKLSKHPSIATVKLLNEHVCLLNDVSRYPSKGVTYPLGLRFRQQQQQMEHVYSPTGTTKPETDRAMGSTETVLDSSRMLRGASECLLTVE